MLPYTTTSTLIYKPTIKSTDTYTLLKHTSNIKVTFVQSKILTLDLSRTRGIPYWHWPTWPSTVDTSFGTFHESVNGPSTAAPLAIQAWA